MKPPKINIKYRILLLSSILITFAFNFSSCKKGLLDETPLGSLNSDIVLTSPAGFQNYLVGLSISAREEMALDGEVMFIGTDVASSAGSAQIKYKDYSSYLNSSTGEVASYWNWAYNKMILQANTVIVYANKPELQNIWASEAERNAIIAEARFYRAYTYNLLANLYGGVPLVDTLYSEPKSDFVRATRKEIYEFALADLEFASAWLPETVNKTNEGRIVKAAADHLLSEVHISLGEYDKAIESASQVINSGLYHIMTSRFGNQKDQPGDVFADLFLEGNQNRSSGNMESIYVFQFEHFTPGGGTGTGNTGNGLLRTWAPFLSNLKDPDGKGGILVSDSLGRGIGANRGSDFLLYDIWESDFNNDIRNSMYNMRRKFYYNNPESAYFGQEVEPRTDREDTTRNIYPYPRKIEGKPFNNMTTSGRTAKDMIVFRLAETYLLRAEAYVRNDMLQLAADDINVLRNRAEATPVLPEEVTLDYILDERARELITEEQRRRTLARMGKLVERVRKYNLLEISRTTIQDRNELWPIPQSAIDANFSVKLEQNPGY